jgi:hypothetical protein
LQDKPVKSWSQVQLVRPVPTPDRVAIYDKCAQAVVLAGVATFKGIFLAILVSSNHLGVVMALMGLELLVTTLWLAGSIASILDKSEKPTRFNDDCVNHPGEF